jgi:CO/xanthine dehydrogenase Mo-binding subunit
MPDKQQTKWVGTGMKRKEDLRLLTGRGCFMDDIRLPAPIRMHGFGVWKYPGP